MWIDVVVVGLLGGCAFLKRTGWHPRPGLAEFEEDSKIKKVA
jgi:hypothetical protein